MLIISRRDEERLGIPQVLDACRCYSPQGRQLKAMRTFYKPSDRVALEKELDAIESLIAFINEHPRDIRRASVTLGRFRDLHGTLSGLEKSRLLEVTEFFEIKQALGLFRELSALEPLLRASSVKVTAMPEAEALLDPGDRKTSGFYIYDEYSSLLAKLRKQRVSVERRLEEGDACTRESLLAKRASIVADEEREEAAVRARLTDAFAVHLEELKANFSAVAVLDFRLARAVLADRWGAGKPSLLNEGDSATLEDMSHPVIEEDLQKRGATFVRQSVSLPQGTTVLSGPNMGGKSVALKSMTLALVLIQLDIIRPRRHRRRLFTNLSATVPTILIRRSAAYPRSAMRS